MKYVPKSLGDAADASSGRESVSARLRDVIVVILCFGLAYIILGFVADLVAESISEETEAEWFALVKIGSEVGEEEGMTQVQPIFDRLTKQEGMRPLPYRLFFLPLGEPNAIAVPGGGVGVTTTLLTEVETEIGVAFVLAHELGHHQHRHSLKRLGRQLLIRGAFSLVFGGADLEAGTAALFLAESSYSRSQETEADEFALQLVHNAYGTVDGSLEFLELVEKEYETGASRWLGFVRSHPLTKDRIDHLRTCALKLRSEAQKEE